MFERLAEYGSRVGMGICTYLVDLYFITVAFASFIMHSQDLIDLYHGCNCNTTNLQCYVSPLRIYACPCPP